MTPLVPLRPGNRRARTKGCLTRQLDQQPSDETIHEKLAVRLFALEGVIERPSGISVPGARALVLRDEVSAPPGAFMVSREFAHLHPPPDQSLHITLPERRSSAAIEAGWAEHHPLVVAGRLPPTHVMVYAPRDEAELEVVYGLVCESYVFACGKKSHASAE